MIDQAPSLFPLPKSMESMNLYFKTLLISFTSWAHMKSFFFSDSNRVNKWKSNNIKLKSEEG